jgi:hypothetical protein
VSALRPVWAVMRMELRRGVSWRSLWLFVMAFAPVTIIAAHAIGDHTHPLVQETLILNGILQIYYVRCGIFFGCLGIFLHLVRGEVAEKTLHYLFLAPVRREALLVGKFLAFWEGVNGALPAWLKHVSVTFYLKPLFAVELPMKGILSLFTVVAEPTPPWLAVSGLVAFTCLVVALACWRMKRLEVSYSSD